MRYFVELHFIHHIQVTKQKSSFERRRSALRHLRSCSTALTTASSMSCLRTGLARKSTVPAFVARTVIGMSSWPVTKMTGTEMFAFASSI